ncbi:hypothetical protein MKW92_052544, partial [Papaver armeniacum]
ILVRTSQCIWSHFTAKGDVEFKVVLFVPPKAPHDLYGSYYNANNSNLKLYVRCVFISDGFDDLLPWYLNFLMVTNFFPKITYIARFIIINEV